MKEINLVLQEKKPSVVAEKTSKALFKIFTVFMTFFVVFALTSFAVLFLLNFKISGLNKDIKTLEAQIVANQSTEQKLVLIKDRIKKIELLRSEDKIANQIKILDENLDLVERPNEIVGLELAKTGPIISVLTENSSDMTRYLNTLIDTGKYKDIKIVSLSYNPQRGYVVDLSFAK